MALDLETRGAGITLAPATSSPTALRIDARSDGGSAVLVLEGEADLATAPALAQALAKVTAHGDPRVVLDVARLDFIDAHCLGVIAETRALLGAHGRELVLRSPEAFVRRVLWVLELDDLVESAGS